MTGRSLPLALLSMKRAIDRSSADTTEELRHRVAHRTLIGRYGGESGVRAHKGGYSAVAADPW
ncbi:hypothetical protein [Nocardia higoensis]|uniref:hypothetical protein n=1 Tax=Nocardia higoensis TaxID=228599 RepID=UPI0003088A98|nr:hypothetical protein [Nocardia higoensis]